MRSSQALNLRLSSGPTATLRLDERGSAVGLFKTKAKSSDSEPVQAGEILIVMHSGGQVQVDWGHLPEDANLADQLRTYFTLGAWGELLCLAQRTAVDTGDPADFTMFAADLKYAQHMTDVAESWDEALPLPDTFFAYKPPQSMTLRGECWLNGAGVGAFMWEYGGTAWKHSLRLIGLSLYAQALRDMNSAIACSVLHTAMNAVAGMAQEQPGRFGDLNFAMTMAFPLYETAAEFVAEQIASQD